MATFDVDVGGVTYEVDAPDERTAWRWANQTHARETAARPPEKPAPARPLTREPTNPIDRFILNNFSGTLARAPDIQGSVPGRFIQGAADLPVGAMQLAANQVGLGEPVNRRLAEINARTQALRGPDPGFDWSRLAGNIAGPGTVIGAAAMRGVPALSAQGIGLSSLIGGGMGLSTPVVDGGNDFWTQKALQTGLGAAVGAAVPAVAAGARLAYQTGKRAFEPLTESGRAAILARYRQGLLGDISPEARQVLDRALREAPEFVPGSAPTSAEALANVPQATGLAAHQADIARSKGISPLFAQRTAEQEAARLAAIREIARTPEEMEAALRNASQNARENYGAISSRLVNPQSDVAIMDDAIRATEARRVAAMQNSGRMATTAAQQENLAHGGSVSLRPQQTANTPEMQVGALGGTVTSPSAYPVPGYPRIPGRYTGNAEVAQQARAAVMDFDAVANLQGKEREFLESTMDLLRQTVGMDEKGLNYFINRPSIRAAVHDAMKSAQETGAYFPRNTGERFSVQNLQRIKESLDAGIDAASNAARSGKRPVLSPQELEGTRREFIRWLSNKVPEWRDARHQYAADMTPVNRMQVGQELEKALVSSTGAERPVVFANAMRNAPQTIKRATGSRVYDDISEILGPQTETARSVLKDLQRAAAADRLASQTNIAGGDALREASGQIRLPNLLSRPAMITNYIMKLISEGADVKINRVAGQQYLNPKQLADALRQQGVEVTPAEILSLMQNPTLRAAIQGARLSAQNQAIASTNQQR